MAKYQVNIYGYLHGHMVGFTPAKSAEDARVKAARMNKEDAKTKDADRCVYTAVEVITKYRNL